MKMEFLFYLLVFPGLLFTALLGLIVGWVDRKVSARFQFRVGPPLLQNFNDFFKLLGKETIVVKEGITTLFLIAPFVALAMILLVSSMVGVALFYNQGFGGDIIVIMYLLMIYSVAVILGGASTGNVYSSIGAGREIKLLLADELAFILVCLIPIIKSGYQLNLEYILQAQDAGGAFIGSVSGVIGFIVGLISLPAPIKSGYQLNLEYILQAQDAGGAFIGSVSGVIGFIVGLICIQAKMTLPPFHIPEAETEIVEGPFMEYSGPPLAFWKLGHFMMWVVFPFLLILLFLGGFDLNGFGFLWAILKYLLIVVLMIIIKNTNPRVRIDTALNFFWRYAAALGFIAVILAVFGY